MNKYGSDEYWNKFLAALDPRTVDRIVDAIYVARGTLGRSEQPFMDDLINALYPYTFFAEACHHMFWMNLRGILNRNFHPIGIATQDVFWPHWRTDNEPPAQTNSLQEIVTELAAIRKELDHLKPAVKKKNHS